ncbi:MAG: hypothetical protein ACI8RZ_002038 [Myxococcota bacterium]|jgi:hypothetical protein
MSDRDPLQDATVLSTGRFKLDARRAMEKLAHFQLEDPHRYVLELVAAAVGAGSRSLTIRNDADDLELAWDGDHPTAEELESLFDHIFYQGDEPRQRMLQHLAQGIYGALGLDPRWIHLARPGLTLDLTDPLEPIPADNERTEGVFVHVRERFSWKVIKEAISPFDDAYETQLLKSLAFLAPMPVVVNGVDITAEPPTPPPDAVVRAVEGGTLWLHDDGDTLDPRLGEGVLLIRDGVCVKPIILSFPRYRLAGWVRCRTVKLNASRSDIVQDQQWAALQGRLLGHAADLIAAALQRTPQDDNLREAALTLLLRRESSRRIFDALPLLRDAVGREWSLKTLARRNLIWTVDDPALPSPEIEAPQFLHIDNLKKSRGKSGTSLERLQWEVIWRLFPQKRHDGTATLRKMEQGRKRRQELAKSASSWAFDDAIVSHEFTDGDFTGIIALSSQARSDGITVEIRVDGLPVQNITVAAIAPVKARIQGGGLEADAAFFQVVDGPARRQIPQVARRALGALLQVAAEQKPRDPTVRRALLRWMVKAPNVPDVIQAAMLFPRPFSPRRSLNDIQQAAGARGKIHYIRHSRLGEVTELIRGQDELAELTDVLLLDPDASRMLKQTFGRRLVDRSDAILSTLKAAHRQRQAPVTPQLLGALDAKGSVEGKGFTGLIGLRSSGSVPTVQVIHKGVDLGNFEVPLRLPGAIASISWDNARPNDAWDGLADPSRQKRMIVNLLNDALFDLADRTVDQWRTNPLLPPWVVTTLSDPVSKAHAEKLWFRTLGGREHSIRQLKSMSPIRYLHRTPASPPPGLDAVLLIDQGRRQILDTHVSPVLSAEAMLRQLESIRKRFFCKEKTSARLPHEGEFVSRAWLSGPQLTGEIGVSSSEGTPPGIRITVLAHSRPLLELSLPHFLPIVAVIAGDGVKPNSRLTGVEDASAIFEVVREAAEEATHRMVSDPRAPVTLQRLLLHRLLLGRTVPGIDTPQAQSERLAVLKARPLFPTLSGESVSLKRLEAAHAKKMLRVALSPGSAPDDDRLWVKTSESRLSLLKLALGQRLPDGEAELRSWRKGEKRRGSLPTSPLIPSGRFAATWLVEEDGAKAWVALTTGENPGLVLEWHIENRLLTTERLPCNAPVRIRLSDPSVKPDRAFVGPQHGKDRNRARGWALSLMPRFLLRLAQETQILEPHAIRRRPTDGVRIFSAEKSRLWALSWASQANLSEAWAAVVLVQTAAGERLSPLALKALARENPLRVVETGVLGMTLDETRPAIQIDAADRRFLKPYGKLVDYTRELTLEAKIQARRNRRPRPRFPETGAEILLTRDAPGKRAGFVQVRTDGSNRIGLHIGWRSLDEGSTKGPVPLSGHISDDTLSPDSEFSRVHRDVAYRRLQQDLTALSRALLPAFLKVAEPRHHRELLFQVLIRTFSKRRDLKEASGDLAVLADMPLFVSGTGLPLTPRQLASSPPRWVPAGSQWPSLDDSRPFVCVSRAEFEVLKTLFGGGWEVKRAEKERNILERQQIERLPFEMQQTSVCPPIALTWGEFRGLFGLVGALTEGSLSVRCEGIPIEIISVPLPGLVGVVEVPRRAVEDDWRSARLSRAVKKGLEDVHDGLINDAADAIRTTASLSRWVGRLISGKGKKGSAVFRRAPLIETVEGFFSVDALRSRAKKGTTILIGLQALDAPNTLVVQRTTTSSEILLDASGIRYHKARLYSETLQEKLTVEAAKREAAEEAVRQAAMEAGVRRHLIALLGGVPSQTRAGIRAIAVDLAGFALRDEVQADPGGAAGRIAAAWVAESGLELAEHMELMLRLGELLAQPSSD